MAAHETIAFLLFAVVAAITPGPSNLILTSTAAAVGVVRGLPALFGQTVGMGIMLLTVGLGLGGLLLKSSLALLLLKACGIAVLLWMAFGLATAGRHAANRVSMHFGFWKAAGFQWVNPKAWLVCAAAVGAYLPGGGQTAPIRAAELAALFVAAAVPSCFVWLAAGGTIGRLLTSERTSRIFNLSMAALLAGSIILIVR